jgi:hypothetical protein
MLRKTILAGAAAMTLAAALAPDTASAWGGHPGWHGWHRGWHHGWSYRPGVRVYAGPIYGGCFERRLVWTPYGAALRWVNVCY